MEASWRLATGDNWPDGRFRCPLCLRETHTYCATLAHAPSQRLGGRPVGLLCRSCNSYLGTTYEADLKTQADRQGGDEVIRVASRGGEAGVYMRAEIKHDPLARTHDITLKPAGKARDFGAALDRLSKEGGIRRLGLGPVSSRTATGGLMAWAYLLWFERLGYPFALVRALRLVRRTLLNNEIEDLGRSPVMSHGPAPVLGEAGRPLLVRVAAGGETVAAAGWWWPSSLVVFPLPEDTEASVYNRLDDMAKDHEWVDVRVRTLHELGDLTFGLDPNNLNVPRDGSLVVFAGVTRVAGSTRQEAREEARHTFIPTARPRARRQSASPRPVVPDLPLDLTPLSWAEVAGAEARRVALDSATVTTEVLGEIAAVAGGAGRRNAAMSRLAHLLDEACVAHIADLERFALHGEAYDATKDRATVGDVPRRFDHIVRGVPKHIRPEGAELRIQMVRNDPEVASAHAFLQWKGDLNFTLIGPFYSAETLLLAIRTRILRLVAETQSAPTPQDSPA